MYINNFFSILLIVSVIYSSSCNGLEVFKVISTDKYFTIYGINSNLYESTKQYENFLNKFLNQKKFYIRPFKDADINIDKINIYIYSSVEIFEKINKMKIPFETYVGGKINSNSVLLVYNPEIPKKFNETPFEFYQKIIIHETFHCWQEKNQYLKNTNEFLTEGTAVLFANQWFSIKKKEKNFSEEELSIKNILNDPAASYDLYRLLLEYLLLNFKEKIIEFKNSKDVNIERKFTDEMKSGFPVFAKKRIIEIKQNKINNNEAREKLLIDLKNNTLN